MLACLPKSGKCEKYLTDPLASYLNGLDGTSFEHTQCLDTNIRNSSQPETLYTDKATTKRLVIERKNLVWPRDYAARHKNDHYLANSIFKHLGKVGKNEPVTIYLAQAPLARPEWLEAIGQKIAITICENTEYLQYGHEIKLLSDGQAWRCVFDVDEREACDEPLTGARTVWITREPMKNRDVNFDKIKDELRKFLESAKKKFKDYGDARRVLLIECYGNLGVLAPHWVLKALQMLAIPEEITDIFYGVEENFEDEGTGWSYERLYPFPA